MSPDPRPTAAERAEAHERFIDANDSAVAEINAALRVLAERRANGGSSRTGPLFAFHGDNLVGLLEQARDILWKAHQIAAADAYDYTKEAGRE